MADTSGQERPGSESGGDRMRDGESRAVMKDVAYADARCVWKEPQG
jgi:hypothetical protein